MSKIAIMTDSASCVHLVGSENDIHVFPMGLIFGEEVLEDNEDLDVDAFFERLANDPKVPTTSQPNLEAIIQKVNDLKEQGYTDVIFVTISNHLSGTFESANMIQSYVEGINIHAFDSLTGGYHEGELVETAAQMAKDGESVETILEELKRKRTNSSLVFFVDDLKYLVKNGRLSNASGFIGNLLKMKPIIKVKQTGEVVSEGKVRKVSAAIDTILKQTKELASKFEGKKLDVHVYHGIVTKTVNQLVDRAKEIFGVSNVKTAPISPVIACHVGPYVYGVTVFAK